MSKEETKKPEDAKMEEAKKQELPENTEGETPESGEKKNFLYNAGYAIGKVWNSKPAKKARKAAKILSFGAICFGGGYAAGKGEIPFVGGKDASEPGDVFDTTATDVTADSDEN